MLDNPAWMGLPLVKALTSFEMRMICSGDLMSKQLPEQDYLDAHAEALSMDVDPEPASFGQPRAKPMGTVTFKRLDYVEADGELIAAMVRYAKRGLKAVTGVQGKEAKGEEVDRDELTKRLINEGVQELC